MTAIAVLHVDDDAALGDLTATFLERVDEGLRVETAQNGAEALDVLEAHSIDCIVSDFDMPEMDGLSLLETVREDRPYLPFILYTGKGSEEIASEAISAGVTDYLQKKSNAEQYELLANRIRNAVSQYRAEQTAAQHERINSVLRKTSRTVIDAETPVDVMEAACESLANSDPYLFAICVEPDPDTDELHPTCWSGEDQGFLDVVKEVGVRMDDSPTGQGPGGKAVREREIQVIQNVSADPDFEPWADQAEARGFESVAGIPLEYGGTMYGVLGVFADRPNAFDETETAVLDELATTIAHAVHARELEQSV